MPRKVGAPRVPAPVLPIYDSIAQASAATGIPVAAFRLAKRQGADGFRWNRVDLAGFLRWWFTNKLEDPDRDWGHELKRAQALREQIRLEEDQNRVVNFAAVEEFHHRLMSTMFGFLAEVFAGQLPPALKGMSEGRIREVCEREVDRLKTMLDDNLQGWVRGYRRRTRK